MTRFRRRFRPKPLTTRRRLTLILCLVIPVIAIFTFGARGILRRVQLEMQAGDLYQQNSRERSIGDSLRSEIRRLTLDTSSIERLARERYGMVRSGETIYKVPE